MKLKTYLFLVFVITLLALGGFLSILFNVDPFSGGIINKVGFFSCLFLFLWGILLFIGFYLRVAFGNREVIFAHLPISARQAFLVSGLAVLSLAMQAMRVLSWWDEVILVAIVILIELFFHHNKNKQKVSIK